MLAYQNITNDYGVLVLAGPKSRDVLSEITNEDLSNENFLGYKVRKLILLEYKSKL